MKKTFDISLVDPLSFIGSNDKNIKLLEDNFSTDIIVRGTKIKLDGKNRLWDVFDTYSSIANVSDVSKHFNGVGSSFGYVFVDKSGNDGLKFTNGETTEHGFLPNPRHFDKIDEAMEKLSKTDNLNSNNYKCDGK